MIIYRYFRLVIQQLSFGRGLYFQFFKGILGRKRSRNSLRGHKLSAKNAHSRAIIAYLRSMAFCDVCLSVGIIESIVSYSKHARSDHASFKPWY